MIQFCTKIQTKNVREIRFYCVVFYIKTLSNLMEFQISCSCPDTEQALKDPNMIWDNSLVYMETTSSLLDIENHKTKRQI